MPKFTLLVRYEMAEWREVEADTFDEAVERAENECAPWDTDDGVGELEHLSAKVDVEKSREQGAEPEEAGDA